MIIPMRKVYVVTRAADKEQLLEKLGELGVVHIVPIDPARAAADEQTIAAIRETERVLQVLREQKPAGSTPNIPAEDAVQEVLDIQRRTAERRNRLSNLGRQLEHIKLWGDVRIEQFEQLRKAGVDVRFFSVPDDVVQYLTAECVEVVGALAGKRSLVALVERRRELHLPEGTEEVPLPPQDAPTLRAEAAEIDRAMKADVQRLAELARLIPAIEQAVAERRQASAFNVAMRSGQEAEALYAIQGWVPSTKADTVETGLEKAGLDAAVQHFKPAEDDQPPTLVEPPAWTRPIDGLFKVLGTVAGYREFDVSVPFMIALPIFAAMLISDGGYGAILLLGPLLLYRKVTAALGERFTQLLMVIGGMSLIWGVITAGFFGVTLYEPLIPVNLSDYSRFLLMRISFIMGAIHLSLAQLWQAVRIYPDLRFLNKVGWATFIWGILGVVMVFVLNGPFGWGTPWPYLLIAGASLSVLFASPHSGIVKRILLGIADFPLSMLSAFSDVISYVRLMAVGLASSVLAVSFNELAFSAGPWPVVVLVLIFGHGLNLGLAVIALFAHGVRLNMLEFSNNLGMQWSGYPYQPFLRRAIQEN